MNDDEVLLIFNNMLGVMSIKKMDFDEWIKKGEFCVFTLKKNALGKLFILPFFLLYNKLLLTLKNVKKLII